MRQPVQSHLMSGPLLGWHMFHDDCHHLLIIRGRVIKLTPTEYVVSMVLLWQRASWESAKRLGRFYTPLADLHAKSGIIDVYLLAKHISNASNKLEPLSIGFVRVGGEGYAVLLEEERAEQEGGLACVAQ